MDLTSFMFGRLTLAALPHEWFTLGGTVAVTGMMLTAAALLVKTKRVGWLWREWLTTTDPKKIGVMYIIVAFLMFFRGGLDAIMIWGQQILAGSGLSYLSADHVQQIFTAHGNIMVFFVTMGFLFGLLNFIIPLQIGARDVASPLLNTLGFWLYVAGAILINMFFVFGGEFSAAGWLAVAPLSGIKFSPGVGVDYWIWSLQVSGLGTLLGGINFIMTIIKMRAPGMSIWRMPIFVWSSLFGMILVLAIFPILSATLALLSLDRMAGMHFFTAEGGGNPMMYVNLIWTWGHPEIYVLILPVFGIYSEVVSAFSQKRAFGYALSVASGFGVMLLSMLVWLHHFFTMGSGADVNTFFSIATILIAIPTGTLIFNWLMTMFRGRIIFASPMYWFYGFLATFSLGGVAGVMLGLPGIDFQVHNSLFLVAHFHTMVIGGALFGIFAGVTYWFPKVMGFKLHEGLGKLAFWLWLGGFYASFIPLYALGIMGATRRLDHYDPSLGWQPLFIVAGLGGLLIGLAATVQVIQIFVSWRQREQLRDTTGDPWNARSLEWSTASPPPAYNFAVIPEVHSRDAWWEAKQSPTTAKPNYQPIHMPKNTAVGIYISACLFVLGFAMVWHLYWLAALGLIGAIAVGVWRTFDDDTEYTISPEQLAIMEANPQASSYLAS
jgi:cytochrome o ubiquinol oxidase subunit 1